MLRVGLTGGVGAGRSTAARRLAQLGAVVVDADAPARAVVAPDTEGIAPDTQGIAAGEAHRRLSAVRPRQGPSTPPGGLGPCGAWRNGSAASLGDGPRRGRAG